MHLKSRNANKNNDIIFPVNRFTKSNNIGKIKAVLLRDVGKLTPSLLYGLNINWCMFWSLIYVLRILKMCIPFDLPVPFRWHNLKYVQRFVYKIFLTVLFKIAINWKQLQCSALEGWLTKLRNFHTMEYYSPISNHVIRQYLMT